MPTILPNLVNDIRYALRQLGKSPGFAATAILTLALGIGATTAIFTLVYQVLLRSMPVAHPEQLYKAGKTNCGGCVNGGFQDDWNVFSTDLYRYLSRETPGIAAVQSNTDVVSARRAGDNAQAQPLASHYVSGNYFSVLGVEPYAGRLLRPEDDREGAAPTAVISYTLWQTKFAADPRLVGSTLLLSGNPVTVVGITAPRFLGERNQADPAGLWLPLAAEPQFDPDQPLNKLPTSAWLNLMVRIPQRSDFAVTEQRIVGGLHQWLNSNRGLFTGPGVTDKTFARQTTVLLPAPGGISDLRDQYEQSLKLLLWVAGFVLLIACANLANLLLVRGMARQQELAVRSALGAPRSRLIRQTLVEAVLISLGGGILAIAVAYAGTRGILALAMRGVELSPLSAAPSLPVLGFALLLSLVTGVLFGIIPAWIGSRSSPVEALRGANRSTRDASALPQRVLVILQAAMSLVLLSTAGLLITSLRSLEHQDFHFEPEGRLVVFTALSSAGYKTDRLPGLYRQFDDTLAHLPGVQSFAYATHGPLTGSTWAGGVFQPGVAPQSNAQRVAEFLSVSPGYFEALGTRILAGRPITDQDTATSTHTAVVNQAFVRRFFPGRSVIGEHFGPDPGLPGEFTIVGVADDTKYGTPSNPTAPMYFTPITQTTTFPDPRGVMGESTKHYAGNLIFRYRGDESIAAASVRRALQQINPDIPILKMQSYADQLSTNFTQQELVVRLTTLFGLLALVLASIGLYGVTAYAVARRTSEIGIRMALGASRGGVLAMIVRTALGQALLGLVLGLPLCFLAAKLVASTLYQTSGFQPAVLAVVAGLLLLSALIAALVPARRAASIDPLRALRTE